MTIQPFKAFVPVLERIAVSEDFFEQVREDFTTFHQQGYFSQEADDAIFIYEIKNKNAVFYGIIACLDVRDDAKGKIKKHEKTIFSKEKNQMELLLERQAMVKPLLLAHQENQDLKRFIQSFAEKNAPYLQINMTESQHLHTFWKVSEPTQIKDLQNIFGTQIENSYVADGHHRLASNVLLYNTSVEKNKINPSEKIYDQILCAFFAADELKIEAFNRVVAIECDDFLEKINLIAQKITSNSTPIAKHHFSIFYKNQWLSFAWKKAVLNFFAEKNKVVLDVDILNEKVLQEILGIEDVRKDARITYIEGVKDAKALEKACQNGEKIAFSLFPVHIKDLMQVADNDDVMPPKSTWFEPRMKNGMLVAGI